MNPLNVRPYQLMCLFCRLGRQAVRESYHHERRLDDIQSAVTRDPVVPITLRCNTDSVYRFQNPGRDFDTPEGTDYNELRDLCVLRKLGSVPGETRPAVEFFDLVPTAIPSCVGICAYPAEETPGWPGCRFAATGNYERGIARGSGAFIRRQSPEERQAAKLTCCEQCHAAARLRTRPHHLLCMTCFHKGRRRDELAPIPQDNLFECIDIIQKNPDIPVELIAGLHHPSSDTLNRLA